MVNTFPSICDVLFIVKSYHVLKFLVTIIFTISYLMANFSFIREVLCTFITIQVGWLVVFTSHRQRGYLETAPPFIVTCERREARFLHRPLRKLNPGPSRGSPLHYRCATPAPHHNSK